MELNIWEEALEFNKLEAMVKNNKETEIIEIINNQQEMLTLKPQLSSSVVFLIILQSTQLNNFSQHVDKSNLLELLQINKQEK
jgi:hypothetical protein